ncbi:type II secretion system protein J [Acaryochloris marina]|uniref:PulJ/GspJ family protein n=1 Tax=Acaryochloris marina TaxID=155978 RepID=UPI001BAFAA7F|nr:hypothetical protein [Acaryochloris marina]
MTRKLVNRRQICSKSMAGFTLTELLVGGVISFFVVTLSGYGLVSILTTSTTTNAQNERRVELNRAGDFIAQEIRTAANIALDASVISEQPAEFLLGISSTVSQVQPVLMLKMAQTNLVPIVYYLATPPSGIWQGPKAIYRWGPAYDDQGTYINPGEPTQWSHEPLIDLIESDGSLPSCENGWNGSGTPGFFACVNATGEIAKVYQTGRINKVLDQTAPYRYSTTTAIRALKVAQNTGNSLDTESSSPSCILLMDEDSIDSDVPSIVQAAQSKGITVDALINKNNPTQQGNPALLWNTSYSGDTVTIPTGQTGDEGVFSLPQTLNGKNGPLSLNDFLAGNESQADLDEVQNVQPLGNTQLDDLVGQSCTAIVYNSDISINVDPQQANLQGARLGRFNFTVQAVVSSSDTN